MVLREDDVLANVGEGVVSDAVSMDRAEDALIDAHRRLNGGRFGLLTNN